LPDFDIIYFNIIINIKVSAVFPVYKQFASFFPETFSFSIFISSAASAVLTKTPLKPLVTFSSPPHVK